MRSWRSTHLTGSRACTSYGKRFAEHMGHELARAGYSVISGLARGIDGCAHRGAKPDTAYVARDVSSLYQAAQRLMNQQDYEDAAKLFDEVVRQHPYSVWARHAQIMSAFNYYLAKKSNDAISSALGATSRSRTRMPSDA